MPPTSGVRRSRVSLQHRRQGTVLRVATKSPGALAITNVSLILQTTIAGHVVQTANVGHVVQTLIGTSRLQLVSRSQTVQTATRLLRMAQRRNGSQVVQTEDPNPDTNSFMFRCSREEHPVQKQLNSSLVPIQTQMETIVRESPSCLHRKPCPRRSRAETLAIKCASKSSSGPSDGVRVLATRRTRIPLFPSSTNKKQTA